MSASATLNLNNYTTVWDHNFATQPNLNGFGTVWGNVQVQNGAAVVTSTAASGWAQSGFMITPSGASAGTGYGLYSVTMSLSDNGAVEGPGGYACLWPSTNNWPGPELDLVEKQGANSGTNGYSTIHWAGAGNSNQYTPTMLGNIDVTQKHTYAMDWEPGRITLYVDGKEIYTTTQNVPKDYANGGQNEAFGVGEEPAWAASQQGGNSANQVQVYDMSYSAYTPGAGGSSSSTSTGSSTSTSTSTSTGTGSTTTGSSSSSGTATGSAGSTVTPSTWITLSNPGTVQEASPGAGVNVTETISDPGLTTAYVMVMNSANQGEANWQAVTLNAAGTGTFTAHFQNSGDYVVAVDNPNNVTDKGWSGPITITDPTSGSTSGGSSAGTSPSGGTSTGSSTGTSSTGSATGGSASGSSSPANATGSTTTGSSGGAATGPTGTGTSTGGSTTGSSSGGTTGAGGITLTGDNLTPNATAWTVVGTLSDAGSTAATFALGDNPGHLFSIDGNKLLINQNLPASAPASYQVGIIAVDGSGTVAQQTLDVAVQGVASPSGGGATTGGTSPSGTSSGGTSGGATDPTGTTSATGGSGGTGTATGTSGGTSTGGTGSSSTPVAASGVAVSATDSHGASASLAVANGTQTFAPGTTGLTGAVSETTANGLTDFTTTSGSGVTGLSITDSAGGSYQTDGFAKVDAALSGATEGDLAVNGAQNASVSLGSGNYTVRVGSAISTATVQMTGGSGTDRMTFIGSGHGSFVAGSGNDVIVGGQGGNTVTFGSGSAQVWGGMGADSYTFHAGDGLQYIETFDAAKGDVLNVDASLKSSLHETAAGGSTTLSFGNAQHGIVLQGVSNFNTAQIHWV